VVYGAVVVDAVVVVCASTTANRVSRVYVNRVTPEPPCALKKRVRARQPTTVVILMSRYLCRALIYRRRRRRRRV